MTFKLTVDAFREGDAIPKCHTCDGEDQSPELQWEEAPVTSQSFALIMDDPDAPVGTWNHWLLWDIPGKVHSLKESFRPGDLGIDGTSDFGRTGYGGPCPPRGHGAHRYFFKIFALDTPSLGLAAGARRAALDAALEDHVLAEAQYMGRYERK